MKELPLVVCSLTVGLLLLSCSAELSPEDKILVFIDEMQSAAEAGDVCLLMENISQDFSDGLGNDRDDFELLVYYYLRHFENLVIIKRVESIVFTDSATAEISLIAAFSGEASFSDIPSQKTLDVLEFEILLQRDSIGDWKMRYAEWEESSVELGFARALERQ